MSAASLGRTRGKARGRKCWIQALSAGWWRRGKGASLSGQAPLWTKHAESKQESAASLAARFFLKPIKYEQLVSHAKNKLHFFFFFFSRLLLFVFFYGEFLTGKLKRIRLLLEWKCAQRHTDRYERRQTDVSTRRTERSGGRQKAYRVLVTAGEALTRPPRVWLAAWSRVPIPVLASHLHLLIKCHNNMIFNFQRASPPLLPRPRDQRPWAVGKVKRAAKLHRIHLRASTESGGVGANVGVSKFHRGNAAIDAGIRNNKKIKAVLVGKKCDWFNLLVCSGCVKWQRRTEWGTGLMSTACNKNRVGDGGELLLKAGKKLWFVSFFYFCQQDWLRFVSNINVAMKLVLQQKEIYKIYSWKSVFS